MNGLDFPRVGVLPSGQLDAITDVGDIRVGHCTLDEGNVHTGVTVVLPNDDPLMQKPLAASCIFNGFGKSVGLMQMSRNAAGVDQHIFRRGNRHGADPCGGVRASGSRPGVVDGQPAGS